MDLSTWEAKFRAFLLEQGQADAAHSITHIERVVSNAKLLAGLENAELNIVIPAAWLHDCVAVAKDSPQRSQASRMAATYAKEWLHEQGYPDQYLDAIAHAIAAHSFSAKIPPETLEAKIVQDADRLDAIGAVGIARCLMIGAEMGNRLYDSAEPFPTTRTPADGHSIIDHFYTKLLTLADTMQTEHGRNEAHKRTAYMQGFLQQLGVEIGSEAHF